MRFDRITPTGARIGGTFENQHTPLTLANLRRVGREAQPPEYPARVQSMLVYISADLAETALKLPNFTARSDYRTIQPKTDAEIGVVEIFRFEIAPELADTTWCVVREL